MTALAKELSNSVPTAKTFTSACVDTNTVLLERTVDAIGEHTQRAWVAKLHLPLAKHIAALVDLSSDMPKQRRAIDPDESLLYAACNALIVFIESHASDTRSAIGSTMIPTLASMAVNQEAHDGEAVQVAMQLLAELFRGTYESRKANREFFFQPVFKPMGVTVAPSSSPCLGMLKNFPGIVASAQTHVTQASLVDVLVSLGSAADSFRSPFFKQYLPAGMALKHKASGLDRSIAALLDQFNDSLPASEERIVSCACQEVCLPGRTAAFAATAHFQAKILRVSATDAANGSEINVSYSSLSAIKFQRSSPSSHTLQAFVNGGVFTIVLSDEAVEKLKKRGALKRLAGLKAQEGKPVAKEPASEAGVAPKVVPAKSKVSTNLTMKKPLAAAVSKGIGKASASTLQQQLRDAEEERKQSFAAAQAQAQARAAMFSDMDGGEGETKKDEDDATSDGGSDESKGQLESEEEEVEAASQLGLEEEEEDDEGNDDDDVVPSLEIVKASKANVNVPAVKKAAAKAIVKAAVKLVVKKAAPVKCAADPAPSQVAPAKRTRSIDVFIDEKRPVHGWHSNYETASFCVPPLMRLFVPCQSLAHKFPHASTRELRAALSAQWKQMDAAQKA